MLFCIHCGKGLIASADKMRSNTSTMGGKCPACGKQDELNMRFCIFCSSPMVLETSASRAADKFSWEMELADDGQPTPKKVTNAALKFKDAVQKTPTKKTVNYLPIGLASGAILGLVALLGPAQDLVKRTYLSGGWPPKSLTVYTKHPFAQVTVYEPSDAKIFTMAETDAKGAVRFVNLEAGDYNMKITGKGLRTAFQQVKIDEGRPTVIGYGDDKIVELQRDPNAAPEDVAQPEASNSSANQGSHERPATELVPGSPESRAVESRAKASESRTTESNRNEASSSSSNAAPSEPN